MGALLIKIIIIIMMMYGSLERFKLRALLKGVGLGVRVI